MTPEEKKDIKFDTAAMLEDFKLRAAKETNEALKGITFNADDSDFVWNLIHELNMDLYFADAIEENLKKQIEASDKIIKSLKVEIAILLQFAPPEFQKEFKKP